MTATQGRREPHYRAVTDVYTLLLFAARSTKLGSMSNKNLVPATRVEHALAIVQTPAQARELDAWLAGLEKVVRKQGTMVADQNIVTLYRLLVQAKGGRLLTQQPRAQGSRSGQGLRPKLVEVGLTVPEAQRWELLGAKSDKEIRTMVGATTDQLTMGAAYAWAAGRNSENPDTLKLDGQYDVILADPPWKYGATTETGAANQHYPTMETGRIAAQPVRIHRAEKSVLFLWATNPLLLAALEVMAAWGFSYKTNIVWVKDKATTGLGFYLRGQHELLLIGTHGSMIPESENRAISVLHTQRRAHSQKPDEQYEIIERMYPGCRYAELFARQKRDGWTQYGAELPAKEIE